MKNQTLFYPSTEVLNIRLKYLATICNGQDYKDVVDDDGEYPVIGSGGPFARATDYLYDQASVLLGRKGTIDNPLYVDYPFWTVDTMFYTRVKSIVSAKYLYYLAKTIPFDYYKYGSAIPSMTQRDLGNICFPVPRNDDVKSKIVDYLDSRTAAIDRVLSEKKNLIELLQEKKTSMICTAVVKGIHSDVALKDSFVDWLGEVPAHWHILTNHQLFAERNIKCSEPDAVLLSVTKHLGVILQSQAEEMNLATVAPAETTEGYKVVRKGDLVMNIMRAKDGSYGISDYDGVISPAYCIYYTRQEANPQYLYYLFKTPMYMEIFKNYSTGIAEHRMRLYPVSFFKIPVVVPPLEEQNEIVAYLDKRVKDIDELITLTQQQIEKLKEYRQSIISEVVTGKVAVE